jgi:hypothetical protein
MQKHKSPLCLKEYFVERIEGVFEVKQKLTVYRQKLLKRTLSKEVLFSQLIHDLFS